MRPRCVCGPSVVHLGPQPTSRDPPRAAPLEPEEAEQAAEPEGRKDSVIGSCEDTGSCAGSGLLKLVLIYLGVKVVVLG